MGEKRSELASKNFSLVPPDLRQADIKKMSQHLGGEGTPIPSARDSHRLLGGFRVGQNVQSRVPQRIGFQPLGKKDYGKVVGPGPNDTILVRFKSGDARNLEAERHWCGQQACMKLVECVWYSSFFLYACVLYVD